MALETEARVTIGAKSYWLSLVDGKPVYGTSQRALQEIPSDSFQIVWDDWSNGLGLDYDHSESGAMTVIPKRIFARPAFGTLNVSAVGTCPTSPRFSFEAQDSNGHWYKYFVAPTAIIKVDIDASPTPKVRRVYTLATSGFNSNDHIGRPVQATTGGVAKWFFPVNNGNRIVYMASPVAVDGADSASGTGVTTTDTSLTDARADWRTDAWVGAVVTCNGKTMTVTSNTATVLTGSGGWSGGSNPGNGNSWSMAYAANAADSFTASTAVVDGASHFIQVASGAIHRAVSSHSAGVAQNRTALSILTAASDLLSDGNWGANFPTDDQTQWIVDLLALDEFTLAQTQSGWLLATELADGSIQYRNILPMEYTANNALDSETNVGGDIWLGNRLLLTTPSEVWRHNLYSALPVGPASALQHLGNDFSGGFAEYAPGAIAVYGEWIYLALNGSSATAILVGKQGRNREVDWGVLIAGQQNVSGNSLDAKGIWSQRNVANRIWFASRADTGDFDLGYFTVGADGNPFVPGGSYGSAGTFSVAYSPAYDFPCNVLMVEARLHIERGGDSQSWTPYGQNASGGSYVEIGSGGLTASGSLYWTAGTSDTGRRWRFQLTHNPLAADTTPSELHSITFHGYYLPDVGNDVRMGIDIDMTARQLGKTRAEIVTELEGYASSRQAFVDMHGTSGHILVRGVSTQGPAKWGAVPGSQIAEIAATILEYA